MIAPRPLRTTVIGSYPFPAWLEFAATHLDQFGSDEISDPLSCPEKHPVPAPSMSRMYRCPVTFPAWVFRISLNTCYSYLRQKKVRSERDVSLTDLEATLVDEGGEAVESDLRKPLDEAISALPPRLKSVFILHDVQGYKHEEIGRLLGCSVGTSKSQLFKARMKLRAFLKARKVA